MSRTLCSDCGANRGVQTSPKLTYCHSCKKTTFNKDLLSEIRSIENKIVDVIDIPKDLIYADDKRVPSKVKEYLAKYYINEDHIAFNGIMWSNDIQRIVFIYNKARSAWARSINPHARNKWLHLGSKNTLYSKRAVNCFDRVVIVEDCISSIRIADYVNCVSLGGTNINNITLFDFERTLDLVNKNLDQQYITWFDGDEAGQKAAEAFRKKYKLYNNIRNIVTKKDPKCHTPTEMQEILNEV